MRPPFEERANVVMARSISPVPRADGAHVYAKRRCRGLNYSKLADLRDGSIPQHRHPFYARRDLFEQFQPFRADAVFERRKSGDVAAWAREAVNKSSTAAHFENRCLDAAENDFRTDRD
jgi:hypothetical protein